MWIYLEDQWEFMNKRLIELEEATRVKVAQLTAQLEEKDAIIQQLNDQIAQISMDSGSSGQSQDLEEQLGVFQELIKQLEAEKRELQTELQQAREQTGGTTEQTEQLEVFQEMIKQLDTEKRELQGKIDEYQAMIKQLTAEKIQAELKAVKAGSTAEAPGSDMQKLEEIILQLQEEKSALTAQVEDLQQEVSTKNQQITEAKGVNQKLTDQDAQINSLKSKLTALETEKASLISQIQTLQSQVTSPDSIQQLESLKEENEQLKTSLADVEKELDDLVKINRDQSERVTKLEQALLQAGSIPQPVPTAVPKPIPTATPVTPTAVPKPVPTVTPVAQLTPTPTPPKPSAGSIRYFTFKNETFLPAQGKSPDITLTLDEIAQKWTLTIAPGTPFLVKNKALRVARTLPNSGWRDPKTNQKIGQDFQIEIIGEF